MGLVAGPSFCIPQHNGAGEGWGAGGATSERRPGDYGGLVEV